MAIQHSDSKKGRRLVAPRLLLLGTLCTVLGLTGAAAAGEGRASSSDDETRALLEKWVETRRIISKERQEWALGRDVLQERIALVAREIETLEERIAEDLEKAGEESGEAGELEAQVETLEQTATVMEETVERLEMRLKMIVPRLPRPLREQVKPLSQSFPEDPEETDQGLSERYRNVVGTLKLVNEFHARIHEDEQSRELPNGGSTTVTVLYLGISHAYYANASGTVGGTGVPGTEGWVWTPRNEIAGDIARAIRIHRGDENAAYVPLPIAVQGEQ